MGALTLVMVVGFGGLIAQSLAGTNAVNAFFYPGTIGVLALMVAYIATNLGAIWHLFLKTLRRPVWQIVFPVARHRVPRVHDLQERLRHGGAVQPLPVVRAGVARRRRR